MVTTTARPVSANVDRLLRISRDDAESSPVYVCECVWK